MSTLICSVCSREYSASVAECPRDRGTLVEPEVLARVGSQLGGYRLVGILGSGGMGVVYRAQQLALQQPVAVKILNNEHTHRPDAVDSILREARAASRIQHPHIVQVFDFGRAPDDGAPYFAMEYLEGESLQQVLRHGRIAVGRALRIGVQIASALAAAHRVGIIHRDLKPENVLLLDPDPGRRTGVSNDFVKVLDFGLAKVFDCAPSERTRSGLLAGTPWYMSPEQARNRPIDGRSDVYALGVVLYQMVTGTVPFYGDSALDILMSHCCRDPSPARERRPGLDVEVDETIMRCLRKHPDNRWSSMEELRERLRSLAGRVLTDRGDVPRLELAAGRPRASAGATGPSPLADALDAAEVPEPTVSVELMPHISRVSSPSGARARTGPAAPAKAASERRPAADAPRPPAHRAPVPARRTRGRALLFAAVAAVALAGVALVVARRGRPTVPAAPTRAAAQRSAPERPAAPAARPASVTVTLAGLPASARVYLDGQPRTAPELELPRSLSARELLVVYEGSADRQLWLVGDRPQRLDLASASSSRPRARVARTAGHARGSRHRRRAGALRRRPEAERRASKRRAEASGARASRGLARAAVKPPVQSAPAPEVAAEQRPTRSGAEPRGHETAVARHAQPARRRRARRTYRDWVVDPEL